jgi:hypothetical protein
MNRPALLLAAALVPAATLTAAAQTLELPSRRPGLWEFSMTMERQPAMAPIVTRMCFDPATERELMDYALKTSRENCSRHDMKRAGKTWVIDSECTFAKTKNVSRITVSGDFQSTVTIRIEGTTEGLPGEQGPHRTLITQAAVWKSADCAGMKPGDIALPGGLKMNVRMLKQLPAAIIR